jgi:xanthosine utilization system XapX-like protein
VTVFAAAIAPRGDPGARLGGERPDLRVAQEVEPLVLVLLLGLVTDYSVFLMSLVAGGVAALVVGRLEFFQTFGPSLAITSLIALAVSITLIPAALALLGGRLFGGKMSASARAAETSGQGRSAGVLTRRLTATRRVPRLAARPVHRGGACSSRAS